MPEIQEKQLDKTANKEYYIYVFDCKKKSSASHLTRLIATKVYV